MPGLALFCKASPTDRARPPTVALATQQAALSGADWRFRTVFHHNLSRSGAVSHTAVPLGAATIVAVNLGADDLDRVDLELPAVDG